MTHISDPDIQRIIEEETARQSSTLTLIPSENHTSKDVLAALGTVLSDKYAEGYPGKRYYAGNEVVDRLETLVQDRAKTLFGVPYVNVQPYSGSPANVATMLALLEPGDTIMGLDLPYGGHLTHGYEKNVTARFWKSVPYQIRPDGSFDMEAIRDLARKHRPKLIICGGTAIPRTVPFDAFAEVAKDVGAYLLADISHIAGLIVGGQHPSPAPYAHVITTTTHKTLRGPRGALIMATEQGFAKDPDIGKKIDKAIIPGFQGGPHMNTIAGIGVALREASQPAFRDYAAQIVTNAKALADALINAGFSLVSGGTETHLLLIDLTATGVGRGVIFQEALERIGIISNKNAIPNDPSSPFYPSGLRLGTPAITTRGMSASDMRQIASWITQIGERTKDVQIPGDAEERATALRQFRESLKTDSFYDTLQKDVTALAARYPIPAGE
jgi:glycine hydroxymethyltransferase